MQIDKVERLKRASALHQQMCNAMPMADAIMELCKMVAEREQQIDHWQNIAEQNAIAGRE